jgi:hypothetical protein
MATDTLRKIKLALRRSHDKLDEDLQADIDACKADLEACGVIYADETNPLVYNAIKLWCKSLDTDDPGKGTEYMARYEKLKASLMMASGYGREAVADE